MLWLKTGDGTAPPSRNSSTLSVPSRPRLSRKSGIEPLSNLQTSLFFTQMVQMRNVTPFRRRLRPTSPSRWCPTRQSLSDTRQRPFRTSHGSSYRTPQCALAHPGCFTTTKPNMRYEILTNSRTPRTSDLTGSKLRCLLGSGLRPETPNVERLIS